MLRLAADTCLGVAILSSSLLDTTAVSRAGRRPNSPRAPLHTGGLPRPPSSGRRYRPLRRSVPLRAMRTDAPDGHALISTRDGLTPPAAYGDRPPVVPEVGGGV